MITRLRSAFTMIELILSLAIFSVIALSIYSVFHAGIEIWYRSDRFMEEGRHTRAFFREVSRDLANAVPYDRYFLSGEIRPEWSRDIISFMNLTDMGLGTESRREITQTTYLFDEESGKVKRYRATRVEGFDRRYAEEETLLENVKKLAFEYSIGTGPDISQYEWSDVWSADNAPPRGVKVTLSLGREGGEGESFETFVFIPMGTAGGTK